MVDDEPSIDSFLREAAATPLAGYPSHFSGTDRYRLVRQLGEGGFGVIFEVEDRKQGGRLALKLLRQPHAERLYRFKREFRILCESVHPNLVRLHELSSEGHQLFFTMELIDGVPLLAHIARNPERARDAFRQLAEGLAALHAKKILHRDIKPSNVMVDRAGRVVLLDFGLALDLGESAEPAGTPEYMSPEQSAGGALDEASDWYSVGLVLHEALTGRRLAGDTPTPLAPNLPGDLDALCRALLAREPAARPRGDEVLRKLHATPAARVEAGGPFIGRAAELKLLRAHADARGCRVVLAHGPSGIGKSTLLRRFLDELQQQRPETLVLAGRCYERESVPYKALDAICDALARHLKQLPEVASAALLPRDAAALTRLFPVLLQVPAFQKLGPTHGEPAELRARGGAALRELFARISEERSLVVCVDDLQWGDADSASLLADLVRGPDAPNMLWLASYRHEEAATSPLLTRFAQLRHSFLRELEVRELALGPLGLEDARTLAVALVKEPARAEALAQESGGSPFFLQELARRSDSESIGELVAKRLASLDAATRRVVEAVAMMARPVDVECLAAAVGVGGDVVRDSLSRLRAERLVRGLQNEHEQLIESYHDRIRQSVAAALSADRLRTLHLELAAALERQEGPDAAEIADHLAEGGETARACGFMVRAAETAEAALAIDEAVRLYRRARELRTERDVKLELAFAEALSTAGHGVEAAHTWLAVVDDVDGEQRADLQRRAAEDLLASGHLDEGWAAMASVLERLGLSAPRSTAGAVARVLWGRSKRAIFKPRFRSVEGELSPELRMKLDTVGGMNWVAWLVNPFMGAALQEQYLPLAFESGDRMHATTALFFEALVSAGAGTKAHARTRRHAEATHAMTDGLDAPVVQVLRSGLDGTVALMEGRFSSALDMLAEAERLAIESSAWPGHGSVRMIVSTMRLNAMFWLGRASDVLRETPPQLQRAEDRGHLTSWLWLRMMEAWALGCCGKVEAARDVAAAMRARMPSSGFELIKWYLAHLHIQFALESGDVEGAWRAVVTTRQETRFSLTSQPQRIFGWWLMAAAALARAATTDRFAMLKEARRLGSRIEGEQAAWALGLARGIDAGVAAVEGNSAQSVALYAEAETRLREHHLELAAAAAACARATLMHDEDAGARALASVPGISRHALWTQLPGGWTP